MKVLIVEEALQGLHGHYFQYLRDMAEGGRQAGHEIELLAHVNACDEIKNVLGAHPVLRRSVVGQAHAGSPLQRLKEVASHNRNLRDDVLRWAEESNTSFDATIFPSVRLDHIWALHAIRKKDCGRRLGHLIAILIDAPGNFDSAGRYHYPRSSWLLRLSLWWIAGTPRRSGLSFAAESAGMVRQFENFSRRHFGYVPHVTEMPKLVTRLNTSESFSSNPLTLGTFGFTRFDKGHDVLQNAIKKIPESDHASFHFVIQWTGDYRLPDGVLVEKDPQLMRSCHVTYLPRFSNSEEYHNWLSRVDAIILPYREAFYQDRLSRVAIDAALVGLPVVYPRRTWLAEFFSSYGAGVAFDAESPTSLTEAIITLTRDYGALVKQAKNNIEKTRRDFSGQEFFSCVGRML
jgi:glycosyltransferase involved in cell wall biosynthesis